MRSYTRLRSVIGVGVHRTLGQLRSGNRSRLILSVTGVAIAIGLMVVVTSTSIGLASETTIYGSNVDYWIVPEGGSASTMAVTVEGPQFGDAHATTTYLSTLDGVQHATPVSTRIIRLQRPAAHQAEYILVIGTLGQSGVTVAGLPTGDLTPGDPYYANGTYNGTWTGDLVASPAASSILNAGPGDTIIPSGAPAQRSFTVRTVSNGSLQSGAGELPVVLVHLSELQALEHTPPRDTADQFLIQTTTPSVRDRLAAVYPESRVVERTGVSARAIVSSELSLAIALSAFVVALIMGTLFVATSLGLEIAADRHQLATLTAIGFSSRSRTILIATQTLTITIVGGLIGVLLGGLGSFAVNEAAAATLGTGPIAILHPLLGVYGIGVAALIGLLCAPYLGWLARRTTTNEDLSV